MACPHSRPALTTRRGGYVTFGWSGAWHSAGPGRVRWGLGKRAVLRSQKAVNTQCHLVSGLPSAGHVDASRMGPLGLLWIGRDLSDPKSLVWWVLVHTLLFDGGGDVALRARDDPVNPGACAVCWRLWDRQRDAPKVGPALCSTVRSGYVPPTPFTYYGRGFSFSTDYVPAYLS